MLKLDLINTVAFGGAVLFVGHGIRQIIPPLARYNLPTLRLWELAGLALPMVVILVTPVGLIAAVYWPLFYMMGRDFIDFINAGLITFCLNLWA